MASSTPVHAVTLDMGNTVLFTTPSLDAVYRDVAASSGWHLPAELDVMSRFVAAWDRCQASWTGLVYGTSRAEALAFWTAVNADVLNGHPLGGDPLTGFVEALYDEFALPRRWLINPDLADLLAFCRSSGIAVAVLSNWDVRLRRLLAGLELIDCFDAVIISAEVALEKPDPEIFRTAATQLGVSPDTILHIGDTWEADIVGARAAGCQAAWYSPGGSVAPNDLEGVIVCRSLRDVIPALVPFACGDTLRESAAS